MQTFVYTLVCLICVSVAYAGPIVDPGDNALRHDIQLLADAGVITGPVSTWPLSWDDIETSLQSGTAGLDSGAQAALGRITARIARAKAHGDITITGHVAAAENPRKIRTFDNEPREQAEIGAGLEWNKGRYAARLNAQWVDDPEDGKDWRYDDSYLGLSLGNWMIAATTSDQYWGPSWQSSMLLSNNARPIPSLCWQEADHAVRKQVAELAGTLGCSQCSGASSSTTARYLMRACSPDASTSDR